MVKAKEGQIQIRSLSWTEVVKGISKLAEELQGKKIWGIPRGGQLVATMLAYRGCILVPQAFAADVFIDDITCTGMTLKKIRAYHMHQELAVLVWRADSCTTPDYYALKFDTKDYIFFPWEDITEAKKLIASGCYTNQDVDTKLGKRT